MKNSIYLLIALFLALGVNGCTDVLDVTPSDELSDPVFWKTQEDVELALTGAYHGWESGVNILFLDAMSDNGYEQFGYGFRQKINGQVSASNWRSSSWTAPASGNVANWFTYERIRKYNNFLTKIEDVELDAAVKERYKAEVRFLRAYDYFNKVMFFGDVPLVLEIQSSDVTMSRTPSSEVKQFILSELEDISNILPVQNNIDSQGHITSGAALALKARLELYMENYSDAMASAKAVIDMGVYELFPDYRGLFLRENNSINKESILEIQYVQDDYYNMLPQLNLPASEGGWSAVSVSKTMVDAYETANGLPITEDPEYDPDNPFENRDPRLEMTVIHPGSWWNGRYYNSLDQNYMNSDGEMVSNPDYRQNAAASRGGQQLKKYMQPESIGDMNNYDANIMVIRLAEVYLIFAEAALKTGQDMGLALDYVNKIRSRAGHVEATELTEELIRRERRVELAFEGLRYFDIKRWDLGPEVIDGPYYGSRDGSVNSQTGEVTWDDEYIMLEERNFIPERNYLLPIPQSEMDANPEMTQNPGY
ncbi:RagB/SusD family nutrient uptake outer membrane protein [Fodinibius sediminis]|uniref:Starch-binding associating with outer membrane n=1 Tax=Fodinibius sediminis TaxID=1214077 RepID=A0A521DMJ0_9BACT|nr:RagB/SusD family nutrient uptake outer membrane protein [Fodinibius sediminis]SMO72896.1 Starch-binding associating with outer membrane [Fodinibius sediminis]